MNLLIANLSCDTSETELREAFEVYGDVSRARCPGRPLGAGSVGMSDPLQAAAALRGLDHQLLHGRVLTVRETGARLYGRMN